MENRMEIDNKTVERRSAAYIRLESEVRQSPRISKRPKNLSLNELQVEPFVFQQRDFKGGGNQGTISNHIESLLQNIKSEPDNRLDPVQVWSVGLRWVIIDGHHRFEAYKLFAKGKGWFEEAFKVPVTVFEGTLEEALIQSTTTNKKKAEALTRVEKGDAGWRIVCINHDGSGGWKKSKKDIAALGFVGSSAVGRMRSTYLELIKSEWAKHINPMDMTWIEAQERLKGNTSPREYSSTSQEALADDWSNRLGKALGIAPTTNPEAFLMAVEKYSSQLLVSIREMIKEDIPYGFDCVDDDLEDDF